MTDGLAGRLRDGCLNAHQFESLADAREEVEMNAWTHGTRWMAPLLFLVATAAPPAGDDAAEALGDTHWILTRLGDAPVTVTSQQREPYLILDLDSRRVSGSGGCNRLSGGFESNGAELTFSQMASTRMACPEGMETEAAFLEALGQVRKWRIAGQSLELFDAAGKLLAGFEARPSRRPEPAAEGRKP